MEVGRNGGCRRLQHRRGKTWISLAELAGTKTMPEVGFVNRTACRALFLQSVSSLSHSISLCELQPAPSVQSSVQGAISRSPAKETGPSDGLGLPPAPATAIRAPGAPARAEGRCLKSSAHAGGPLRPSEGGRLANVNATAAGQRLLVCHVGARS